MNADKYGNKIAEPKIEATTKSAKNREIAMRKSCGTKADDARPDLRCPDCGFHIRSKDHVNGAHHNGRVARMVKH